MKLYKRENYLKKIRGFYDADDIIKVITGVRRCGKSCLMQMIADELEERGVARDHIIYIDLDRRGFKSIRNADALEELILKSEHIEGLKYIFIDEVQNVSGFEEVLNYFRTEGDWSIFITGSNSYLLSGELVTKLTGRYIEFEMYPLTFDEYEGMKRFCGKTIDPNPQIELAGYILEGGFPRVVELDDIADKRRYVRSLAQEIFEKDIRRRVKVRDRENFELVRSYVINNFGATTSIRSLHRALKESGLSISKATVTRYVQALIDAKILYECGRFDMKSKKSLRGEKKYYLADLSFYFAENTDNRINYGPALENMVYLYAKAHDYSISVGRIGNLECDFILRGSDLSYVYAQVAYTIALDKGTEDREFRPLEAIRDNFTKYVFTTDYLPQQRNGIRHENLMDFLGQGKSF